MARSCAELNARLEDTSQDAENTQLTYKVTAMHQATKKL